jgi:hypothetical protein
MVNHYRDVRNIPADRITIGIPFYDYLSNGELAEYKVYFLSFFFFFIFCFCFV